MATLAVSPPPPQPPSRGLHSLFGPNSEGGSPSTGELVAMGVLALVLGLIVGGRRLLNAVRGHG